MYSVSVIIIENIILLVQETFEPIGQEESLGLDEVALAPIHLELILANQMRI